MISEKGTIITATKCDDKMQKELSAQIYKFSLAFLIIGAVGLAVFIALEVVFTLRDMNDDMIYLMLVLFAVILACGIFLTVIMKKTVSKARTCSRTVRYEFFANHFTVVENNGGEDVANAKVYYTQITRARESASYFFFYINAQAAYPVAKESLSVVELNTLRSFFRLPVRGEGVNLPTENVSDGLNEQ